MTGLRPLTLALGSLLIPCLLANGLNTHAQDTPQPAAEPAAQPDPIGYFLGLSVGQQMAQQGFESGDFTGAGFADGIVDALAGNEPRLSDAQIQQASERIQTILETRQQEMMAESRKAGAANLEKSKLFLEENAKAEGVKSLAGGLQYKVLTAGSGESPKAENVVRVHYTGKLIDGTVFDSSVERGEPAEFGVGQVIAGWQQALQQMKVGDKWMLFIPPQLAYGAQGAPGGRIGPNETLIFEVELLEIVK